jgi:hypothetical protein
MVKRRVGGFLYGGALKEDPVRSALAGGKFWRNFKPE